MSKTKRLALEMEPRSLREGWREERKGRRKEKRALKWEGGMVPRKTQSTGELKAKQPKSEGWIDRLKKKEESGGERGVLPASWPHVCDG